jgi:Protein of unknown function (DUF2905)
MPDLGKLLIVFGIVMIIVGGFFLLGGSFAGKVPWLGRLPGDIRVERENWSFYFPIVTCLVISLVLTLIFALFGRR